MPVKDTPKTTADISIGNINGKTILSPRTSLIHKNCVQLKTLFDKLIEQGVTQIILDLNQVDILDSRALELMVEMQDRLQEAGGNLALSNLNPVCRNILICVRLSNRFTILATGGGTS
nr:STAS domain-containing protein [uncultured Desulfobacter sp.]